MFTCYVFDIVKKMGNKLYSKNNLLFSLDWLVRKYNIISSIFNRVELIESTVFMSIWLVFAFSHNYNFLF